MSGYFAALSTVKVITELARANSDVVLISQDFGPLNPFTAELPERHIDVGISEQNLIGIAAGMAHAGKLPFVFGMAPFVSMRGFEQIRDDCAYNRNHVKIIAPFAGLEAGAWGATHHAMEDIALLRTIPGMTILSPADPAESLRAVRAAAGIDGPVYVRLGSLAPLTGYAAPFVAGQAVRMRDGGDLTIIATGGCVRSALTAAETLAADGVQAGVLNMHTLKPLDVDAVVSAVHATSLILTAEEHSIVGGLGGAVAEIVAELGAGRLARVGIQDVFCTEIAPYPQLLEIHAIDAAGIVRAARRLIAV